MNTAQLLARTVEIGGHPAQSYWRKYAASAEEIRQVVLKLPPDLLRQFEVIVKRAGSLPFNEDKIGQWHSAEAAGAYLLAALPYLQQLGLIAALRKSWGERIYFIPRDVYFVMIDLYWSRAGASHIEGRNDLALTRNTPLHLEALPGSDRVEAGEGAAGDVFRLLVYAVKEGLPITAKGVLHKKTMQRLFDVMEMSDEALMASGCEYPQSSILAPSLAVTLDIALRFGVLRKEAQQYAVRPDMLQYWIQQPLFKWRAAIFEIAFEHFIPGQSGLKHAIAALAMMGHTADWRQVDASLQVLAHDKWLHADEMPAYRSWLLMTHTMGFCDLGTDVEGNWWYRWKESYLSCRYAASTVQNKNESESFSGLFIQPDFEIIVPPDCPLHVRWELEMMAERVSSDAMHTFRLTRDSYTAAVERGYTIDRVVSFMESYAFTGIPHNVMDAVERWHAQYGRVQFAEVVLLRCADEEAAAALRSVWEATGEQTVLTPIGTQDFIVERQEVDRIRRRLEQIGMAPMQRWGQQEVLGSNLTPIEWNVGALGREANAGMIGVSSNEEVLQDETSTALGGYDAKGMVYSPSSLQYYEMDTDILQQDAVLSPFYRLPVMWTNAVRSYHASTMKELVQTAIEQMLPLEVEPGNAGSEREVIVPFRVQELPESAWLLEASISRDGTTNQTKVQPDQWKGVRILLPEWLERVRGNE
ncbi:helicase-associated domain-containing protein [Paenibacillus sp. UMB4589-SE434]|uniref:helicase-associated domain-containing protein n=1 Tax=Paenibacillus sp. UMB4589-SE434 TaxID=3046314 RepID=UPI00254EB60C|nr:helicase-associated domain-containing protein [Paenibacillus sp. UMB4589-SE434]MDK8180854.1 helicase-associated domain-containing protein [Paenibacillus sp. UMB4589-SE434]